MYSMFFLAVHSDRHQQPPDVGHRPERRGGADPGDRQLLGRAEQLQLRHLQPGPGHRGQDRERAQDVLVKHTTCPAMILLKARVV